MPQKVTLETRKAKLDREIAKYSKRGYRVSNRTDTTAQLVKPRQFSCLAACLWFLLFGIGLLIYIFYYLGKNEDVIYLTVDEYGHIRKR